MGVAPSKEKQSASTAVSGAPVPPAGAVRDPAWRDDYVVERLRGFSDDSPRTYAMRIEPEAMAILDAGSKAVSILFPFHRILCWGFTEYSFQWRAYGPDAENGGDGTLGTYAVSTDEGALIEAHLMSSVTTLMGQMKARGVPDAEFVVLVNTLQELADEGLAEHCLAAVRQMALGRALDVKQAATLTNTLGLISPFDKVEAAVALYPCLLNPSSLPILLACFEDKGDADNVCHRLGVAVGPTGEVTKLPAGQQGAAARAAARSQAAR